MKRKTVFRQWIRIVLGLLVFALGVHLTIFANIGLAPWDCLGMGIAKHTPLNYGLSMTVMAVAILGIDLPLRERIGFGTVLDALLTGNFVQMYNDLDPLPENTSLALGVGIMQLVYSLLRFEPREIEHRDILETARVLVSKADAE